MNMAIHNFEKQLTYSVELSDEPSWIEFYKKLWPDMVSAEIINDLQQQRWGIDRRVKLKNGNEFTVDEKKRKDDWGDLLLEEWSVADFDWSSRTVIKGKKVGWALDDKKRCDFIAYAIPTAGKCFLLPFELTRQTFMANITAWKNKGPKWYPKPAKNNGYTTINVAVPWTVFKDALWEQSNRQFGDVKQAASHNDDW